MNPNHINKQPQAGCGSFLYRIFKHLKKASKFRVELIAICAACCCGQSLQALAIGTGDADTSINSFNSALLYTSGSTAYYMDALDNSSPDAFWAQALDIQGEEDAFERTGSSTQQQTIVNLENTFLSQNAPPWSWDGWNDDIGWVSLALARAFQMTGTANFLTQAEYGYNFAYGRGWDTTYNGGGIWEEQPANDTNPTGPVKSPLSNDSLGKTACMLYQSTGTSTYLTQAEQIYSWVRSHLFNPGTGEVYASIHTNGVVTSSPTVYSQGTFLDFANLLYEITGNQTYYNDAVADIQFTETNLTHGGIMSNSSSGLNTWQDEFARGIGHFVAYNNLWSTYYPFMLTNANAAWASRRPDLNITWNGWDSQTPTNNAARANIFVSAVAMMQVTPATRPPGISGTHYVFNKYSGLVLDDPGFSTQKGTDMDQWGYNGGANQQWTFRENSDGSYTITNGASGMVLEDYASATTNGAAVDQWTSNGNANQHWTVSPEEDGCYIIVNKASGKDLEDYGWSTSNGGKIDQWTNTGGANQRWRLQ